MNNFRMIGRITKITKNKGNIKIALKPLRGKSSVWNCCIFGKSFDGRIDDIIELLNYEPVNKSYNLGNTTKYFCEIEFDEYEILDESEFDDSEVETFSSKKTIKKNEKYENNNKEEKDDVDLEGEIDWDYFENFKTQDK